MKLHVKFLQWFLFFLEWIRRNSVITIEWYEWNWSYRTSETAVADLKRAEMELSEEVEMANVRISEINDEMASIMEQLGEAKVDKHESSRAIKKKELLENLRRLFPGVVSIDTICW